MTVKTTPWDVADYLTTDEDRAAYLDAALEEAGDDAGYIAQALGNIARARGMEQTAQAAGFTRQGLYKALSAKGNPNLATLLKVLRVLGIKLHAAAA